MNRLIPPCTNCSPRKTEVLKVEWLYSNMLLMPVSNSLTSVLFRAVLIIFCHSILKLSLTTEVGGYLVIALNFLAFSN